MPSIKAKQRRRELKNTRRRVQSSEDLDLYLNTPEVAACFNVTSASVISWVHTGRINGIWSDEFNQWLYKKAEVQELHNNLQGYTLKTWEVSQLLGVSKQKLYRLVQEGT